MKLIDFGLATVFVLPDGSHINERPSQFSGNPIFCSKNQLLSLTPSRRDDLIALVYVLLYLYEGRLWFFLNDPSLETIEYIAKEKIQATPEGMCEKKSEALLPFIKMIFEL